MEGKIFVGFDLETADSFEKEGHDKTISELGAVKYIYRDDKFIPLDFLSILVNEGKGVHADAEEYTGINTALIEHFGKPLTNALMEFNTFILDADYLVSHNGDNFDIPVIQEAMIRDNQLFDLPPNIDTLTCVPYPKNCKQKNLTYLQAFHGFANPFPHRACTDVMTMFKVMENYDIVKICEVAVSPIVKYTASFQYPKERGLPAGMSYAEAMRDFNKVKDTVKGLGFRWNPDGKVWVYEGKELIFEETIREQLPCPVRKV